MRSNIRSPFRWLGSSLCVGMLVLLAAGRASARPLFPNPVFDAGNNPAEVLIADVNGDGLLDQVVGDYGQDQGGPPGVSVLLGRGDGSFAPAIFRGLTGSPQELFGSDLDGDGALDLVLFLPFVSPYQVILLHGNGDGTFGPEQPIASAGWVDTGDFNGDGRTDILLIKTVLIEQVLFGQGNGSFIPGPQVQAPFAGRTAVADINGDGKDDFVLLNGNFTSVVVQMSLGNGTFDQSVGVVAAGTLFAATLADLTGDGHADLALQARLSASQWPVSVYPGHGDGTFDALPSFSVDVFPGHLKSADLNGDGRGDLIVINANLIYPMISLGDGTLDVVPGFIVGDGNNDAAIADLDRDGRVDLTVVAGQSNASFTLFGNGDGTFGPTASAFPGVPTDGVAVADFNGDGKKDIALANATAGDIEVFLGNGDGTFGPAIPTNVGITPEGLVAADFDRDGHVDLAVTEFNWDNLSSPPVPDGDVRLLLGRGDGRFQAGGTFSVGTSPTSIVAADFNGDGFLDLATANQGVVEFGLYGDLSVLLGNAAGGFAPETRLAAGIAPDSLAAGDFNADGRPDLAVADQGSYQYGGGGLPGDFSVLTGRGDGTFNARSVLAQGDVPRSVAVADFDGNGRDDVAAVDEGTFDRGGPFTPGHLTVFLGNGNAQFSTTGPVDAGIAPYHVGVADLTGDGVKDLVLSNDAFYVSLFPGTGAGTFLPQQRFGFGPIEFVIDGDFNSGAGTGLAIGTSAGLYVLGPAVLVRDLRLDGSSPLGKGSGTLSWTTTRETDLKGFNIVTTDNTGRRIQLNLALIPCQECITGSGSSYTFILGKHKSGRDVFVEAEHQDGHIDRFGPATRR